MTSSCSSTGFSTSPTAGEGRGGEGCSFPAVPKIRRWPKPTIPLHRTGNLNHLSLWRHPLSSKDVLSISSSILSTTRCGDLYGLGILRCKQYRHITMQAFTRPFVQFSPCFLLKENSLFSEWYAFKFRMALKHDMANTRISCKPSC